VSVDSDHAVVVAWKVAVITVVKDGVPVSVVQEDEVGDAALVGVHKAYVQATATSPGLLDKFARCQFGGKRGQGD